MSGPSAPHGQWVEIEVEYVRTEKKRVKIDVADGFSSSDATSWEVGRFSRALNFHMHHGKNLALGEKPRLLSWRLAPPPSCGFHIAESVPGDEESGCLCLRPEGHDGDHSPFSNIGRERISATTDARWCSGCNHFHMPPLGDECSMHPTPARNAGSATSPEGDPS